MMKIGVVTTSRADYGLLYWPLKQLLADEFFCVQLVVSGSHLSPSLGLTVRDIEQDGFRIDWRVDMLLASDTALGACKSLALATIGFAEYIHYLKPDLLLLVGDRYELLAAAQAAVLFKIPIAHIAGGDITEAAFDDAFRHSITKMSSIHFPTNAASAERIKQLGESPDCIFSVGSPGLDYIRHCRMLTKLELETALNFKFRAQNLLVTFHPETLEPDTASHFAQLLTALGRLDPTIGIIFTAPNADPGGAILKSMIADFGRDRTNVTTCTNLGSQKYLSLMSVVDAVVGNSSSGLYEAPSIQTPTVNIGDRQKGRLRAPSVVTVEPKSEAIFGAIHSAMELDCSNIENPYGDGFASEKIVSVLKGLKNLDQLVRKQFNSSSTLCATHS